MLLGILILIIGFLSLLEVIFPIFNFGFWLYISTILFVCGLYKIKKEKQFSLFNIFVTIMGLLFLLINLHVLPPFLVSAIIPLLIILLGITIIYNTSTLKKPYSKNVTCKKYSVILCENKEKVKNIEYNDIECYTVFGSIKLDVSELEIKENTNLNVYSIFGESTIIVSDKYNISTTSTTILGENIKKFDDTNSKSKKTLNINCITIIGGSKIKKND